MANANSRRLFFALWPDDAVAQKILDVQANLSLSGRISPRGNLHITLAFVGEADEAYYLCLQEAAADVSMAGFTLRLDQLGYFKRPGIVWLGPSEIPSALQGLHKMLNHTLSRCGYEPDQRFRPHVTLARKSPPVQPKQLAPVEWRVEQFVLVESQLTERGSVYRVLHRYPLQNPT